MSTILKVIQTLFNFFCGSTSSQQEQEPQKWESTQQSQAQQPVPHNQAPQQQPYRPPYEPQTHPSSPQPHQSHHLPSPRPHEDLNQLNQNNPHYTSLRARANEEGDAMAHCFQESHEAYARGDGARAKALSNEGKEHQRKMQSLHKEASDWIFIENNKDSQPGEIDLHGLYVREAISYTDRAIQEAKQRGDSQVHLIVGKGLHSSGGVAKIKPAIEELMEKHQLVAEPDPQNSGVLIVQLNARRDRGVGPDEIARHLDGKDEACIVM